MLFILRASDRVISENIIIKNRIRVQIYKVTRRLQHIIRICVRNLTFRRPHTCAVDNFCHTFVAMRLCYTAHLLRYLAVDVSFNFGRRLIRYYA